MTRLFFGASKKKKLWHLFWSGKEITKAFKNLHFGLIPAF